MVDSQILQSKRAESANEMKTLRECILQNEQKDDLIRKELAHLEEILKKKNCSWLKKRLPRGSSNVPKLNIVQNILQICTP